VIPPSGVGGLPPEAGSIIYTTSDSEQQIYNFYDSELSKASWVLAVQPFFKAAGLAHEYTYDLAPRLTLSGSPFLVARQAYLIVATGADPKSFEAPNVVTISLFEP